VQRTLRDGGEREEQLPRTVFEPRRPRRSRGSPGVHVEGLDDVMVRLSRCCTPVPSDEIIGIRPVDGHVLAEVLSGKEGLVAKLTTEAPLGSSVVVTFDPADWSAAAVRQNPAGNEVMLGTGRLSIRMQRLGPSQYLLYLARKGPAGSPLRITIDSPNGSAQGELATGTLRSGS